MTRCFFSRLLLVLLFVLGFWTHSPALNRLKLATTTSTENSGLLKQLHPVFEKRYGFSVHTISVGTGKALRLGQNGDVDVVLVHAKKAEDLFMASGYGVHRRAVMYNDFVIVGPASDPAGVFKTFDVSEALLQIKNSKSLWFSRGDDSGTHKKEMELWRDASVSVFGSWYRALGQGMGRTLMAADEKSGYTLTDRSTYIALVANGKVSLKIQGPRGGRLHNPYSVIAVNPKRHPHVKFDLAVKYINFLTSGEGQGIIRDFRLMGKQLFYPNAKTPR
ncbi:MAG: substrate-binding domain-containing protein [Nitrospinae bacterium]|nr:substrate-binding domain-containing protein [Nitrospinota bacterium]